MEPQIPCIRSRWTAPLFAAGAALLTCLCVRWLGTQNAWETIVTILLVELFLASCAVILCIMTERLSATYLSYERWSDIRSRADESSSRQQAHSSQSAQLLHDRQATSQRLHRQMRTFYRQVRRELDQATTSATGAFSSVSTPKSIQGLRSQPESSADVNVVPPIPSLRIRRAA